MAGWTLNPAYAVRAAEFASLEAVFALQGECITQDACSEVIRVAIGGVRYYVKRYHSAGSGLRCYLPRPRIKAEWQNLRHFSNWGVPTPALVAYGMERRRAAFVRGALITQELVGAENLWMLDHLGDQRLQDRRWVDRVSRQLAVATRAMHQKHFAHNDLKWRNLLVNEAGDLFFIDCPTGSFWWGPFLRYRIDKDLACLDKVAKQVLTRTQRLRFYLQYRGVLRLTGADKRQLRRILKFFEGRE